MSTATIKLIFRVTCEEYGLDEDALRQGDGRRREHTEPRQVAMALLRRHTTQSLQSIAQHFGCWDHTTVLNAIKKADKWFQTSHAAQAVERRVNAMLAGAQATSRPGGGAALSRKSRAA